MMKKRKSIKGKEGGRLGKERSKRKVDSREMLCVGGGIQIRKTQDEPQWIVAQRLLSALTIPGFS